jgi:hypothetical protein
MENDFELLTSEIAERQIQIQGDALLEKFGLKFNPFPRSGISDLNSSDELLRKLAPIDKKIREELRQYVLDSLFPPSNPLSPDDKYMSAVIRGDYGYGKTQTLLYVKVLLESFSTRKNVHKNPYVVFIQNPGAKLTVLIGTIISQIGEENFKKYLWDKVLSHLLKDEDFRNDITALTKGGGTLFDQEIPINPFTKDNTVNFKKFLDTIYKLTKSPKELQEKIREHALKVLNTIVENLTVANYFYDFLIESAGISKTWDSLVYGTSKSLDNKEVNLLKAVIKIIRSQGFTDFYILVDEFEAVAGVRNSKVDIESYFKNLRALIDSERNWCAVFAMTNSAFERVRISDSPLAQRLSTRTNINLEPLNNETAQNILINYLNLARDVESDSMFPFDESGVESLRIITKGIPRNFLKSCYLLIQRAGEEFNKKQVISKDFVERYIEEEFE